MRPRKRLGLNQAAQHFHLGATIGSFRDAKANEDGVGHFDQDVVHAVDVDELDAPLLHVLQDLVAHQGTVQATVAICNTGASNGFLPLQSPQMFPLTFSYCGSLVPEVASMCEIPIKNEKLPTQRQK